MSLILELAGLWVLASVLTVLAFNAVKHAVMSASRP